MKLRKIVIAAMLATAASGAAADECYRRDYSDDHLRKHPSQQVQSLQVLFKTEDRIAQVEAYFRDSDTRFHGGLYCWTPEGSTEPGALICGVECDGGIFRTQLTGADSILVRTPGGFLVGGNCEDENTRLVTDEGAVETVFKLFRIDATGCQ